MLKRHGDTELFGQVMGYSKVGLVSIFGDAMKSYTPRNVVSSNLRHRLCCTRL